MIVETNFVYDKLVKKLQYPQAPIPNTMFEINSNNHQLIDKLAEYNAYEFGDYALTLNKRITYECKHIPAQDKPLEATGLFVIVTDYMSLLDAIYFERPFLYFGDAGFSADLQSQGYKLYNKIIDYSFDSETNITKRMQMFIDQILTLNRYTNPIVLMKSLNKERIHNRKWLFQLIDADNKINTPTHLTLNTLQKFKKLL